LHLGNLLGAILRWVRMQDEAECLFFLADLHAITIDVEPNELKSNIREMAAALIASGIDPAKSILFQQSAIPAHAELAWILQCTARVGWLNRMTQFKEKSGKSREGASVGLYTYPVLQAADVLLYRRPTFPSARTRSSISSCPRHRDQVQHRLRRRLFSAAEPFIAAATAARVMSLRDGNVENVQVRPVGHEPHQSHRQRRSDRAEDPQGEDRSGAAARRPGRSMRGPKRRTSSASMLRSPTRASSRCSRASPVRASGVSSRACGCACRSASSAARLGWRTCATIPPSWTGCWRQVRPAARARRANPERYL
jgi:hypothetical protein